MLTTTSIHAFSCPRPMLHKPQCIVWPSRPRGLLGEPPSSCRDNSLYHHAQLELSRFQTAQKLKRPKMTSYIYILYLYIIYICCSFMFFPRFSFKIKQHFTWCCHTLHHPRGLGNVRSCWRMGWECPPETATTTSRDLVKFNWVMKIMIQSSFPLLAR